MLRIISAVLSGLASLGRKKSEIPRTMVEELKALGYALDVREGSIALALQTRNGDLRGYVIEARRGDFVINRYLAETVERKLEWAANQVLSASQSQVIAFFKERHKKGYEVATKTHPPLP